MNEKWGRAQHGMALKPPHEDRGRARRVFEAGDEPRERSVLERTQAKILALKTFCTQPETFPWALPAAFFVSPIPVRSHSRGC